MLHIVSTELLRVRLTRNNKNKRALLLIAILILLLIAYVFVSNAIFSETDKDITVINDLGPGNYENTDLEPSLKTSHVRSDFFNNYPEIQIYNEKGIDIAVHKAALQEAAEYTLRLSLLEQDVEKLVFELKQAMIINELEATLAEYRAESKKLESNRTAVPAAIANYSQDQLKLAGDFTMTAYCNCVSCCGSWSIHHSSRVGTGYVQRTAGGFIPTPGVTVAVDTSVIPIGTWLYIEGYGIRQAQDTGSGVKGKWIDMYMGSHTEALVIGRRTVTVWIIQY